jgi:hydroxymethylbilane synthase
MKRAKIVIGSRGSKLALIQANSVAAKIKEINPGVRVEISEIVTTGDRNHDTQLDNMGGDGVFVKELEEALLSGRIDIAVHSLKDVPVDLPPKLCLLGTTERLDPRDVLISRTGQLDKLTSGSKIGTGSLRRIVQLTKYRSDLATCSIRGNVDTRLRKVSSGEVDAVIVAAAAMLRLGWADRITEYLPLEHFLPAVGQGAIVMEARLEDEEVAELVSSVNNLPVWQCVTAERACLSTLGGGCRAPIAALGTANGATLKLEGMVANESGNIIISSSEEGNTESPEEVGVRLAQKLLQMGATKFIVKVKADE